MAIQTATECGWCGNELTAEESKHPEDRVSEPICCECFHEHYEFTCDKCENYEHIDHQHQFLVVYEKEHGLGLYGDVEPGIYEIVNFPHYGGPMIGGGWLYNDSLRKTPATIDWEQGAIRADILAG